MCFTGRSPSLLKCNHWQQGWSLPPVNKTRIHHHHPHPAPTPLTSSRTVFTPRAQPVVATSTTIPSPSVTVPALNLLAGHHGSNDASITVSSPVHYQRATLGSAPGPDRPTVTKAAVGMTSTRSHTPASVQTPRAPTHTSAGVPLSSRPSRPASSGAKFTRPVGVPALNLTRSLTEVSAAFSDINLSSTSSGSAGTDGGDATYRVHVDADVMHLEPHMAMFQASARAATAQALTLKRSGAASTPAS
jgi:hypothetical protein